MMNRTSRALQSCGLLLSVIGVVLWVLPGYRLPISEYRLTLKVASVLCFGGALMILRRDLPIRELVRRITTITVGWVIIIVVTFALAFAVLLVFGLA